jgi:hypothetical protein
MSILQPRDPRQQQSVLQNEGQHHQQGRIRLARLEIRPILGMFGQETRDVKQRKR